MMHNTGINRYSYTVSVFSLLVVTVYICLWNKEAILQIELEGKPHLFMPSSFQHFFVHKVCFAARE